MALPPHYAPTFTPTTHSTIPPNIDPRHVRLRAPFTVVVTGAGKGLGRHIALAYARAGASALSISSRTLADLEALEREIGVIAREEGREVEVLKGVCDVCCAEGVGGLVEGVRERWGRVDVVVANAGVISKYVEREGSVSDGAPPSNLPIGIVADTDWSRVLDTNLLGVWRIAQAFMPLLASTTDGAQTLICSTSLAAHSTDSALTPIAYNVSKLACCRLIEHIAADHAKEGICAYALHPGAVLTPQTQHHQGPGWDTLLSDDEGLAGAFCVWLSREKRAWLSGRYVSCNWDVDELVAKREEIVAGGKLVFRMVT